MHGHLLCPLRVLPGLPKEAESGLHGVGRGPVHRQLSRFGLQGHMLASWASISSRLRQRIPGRFPVLDQPALTSLTWGHPGLPLQNAIRGCGDMRKAAARGVS